MIVEAVNKPKIKVATSKLGNAMRRSWLGPTGWLYNDQMHKQC